MARPKALPVAAVIFAATLCTFGGRARADTWIYKYAVEHPTFGHIGSYTNIVERTGDRTHVESQLHVAVRLLGFVIYRQDATRSEDWLKGRLVSFHGVTTTDGKSLDVSGEARGNTFVITSPAGVTVAPADVRPSNPWSATVLKANVMMSTKTGEVENVRITGGTEIAVTFDGRTRLLHQYLIDGRKRGLVWLDDRGAPIAFQVWERGTPIDLVLVSPPMPYNETAMAPR
ncbi:MAG: hypothetical protein KGL11_11355 [Alphaproteobacteria bacterium]|nr:hypothetical protein [Alphaproteobacteria bacterium]